MSRVITGPSHTLYLNKLRNFRPASMASFFGEVVTGSYRFIDPEDPDYNDLRAARQSWSLDGDIPKEEKVLEVLEVSSSV